MGRSLGCNLRVAIVHHWFVTQGGGERVLEALASMFPGPTFLHLSPIPDLFPPALEVTALPNRSWAAFHGRIDCIAIFCRSIRWRWSNLTCAAMTWSLLRMPGP